LFFGTLKPNERVEIRIPLQRSEAVVAAALEVRSDLEYVQAEVGKSANELRVSLRAPEKEGRFSGVIRIRLVSPDAKSGLDDVVELPVSGIVEQGAP
jgi:hypothetical protein